MGSEGNYKVYLHYWDSVPAVSDPAQLKPFRSGHVALEVKKDGITAAYLGWWPMSYTVQRERTKRSLFQKIMDRLLLWFTCVEGRVSSYATIQDAKAAFQQKSNEHLIPDQIDSVLVGNKNRGKERTNKEIIDDWLPDQVVPTLTRELTGNRGKRWDSFEVGESLKEFREKAEKNEVRYQFLFNNCATVIAKVLKESGYPIGSGPWWPSRLTEACLTEAPGRIPTVHG